MAVGIFKGAAPKVPIAVLHGALAATARVLALLAALAAGAATPVKAGAVVLLVAALGGFFLLSFHVRGKPHPRAVVVLHALLAVAGVACLLVALVG